VKFRVVLPKYQWWRCLDDLAECLAQALHRDGHSVERSHEFRKGTEIEIALGAHEPLVELPDYPVVIYQTEVPSSGWFTDAYRARLRSALAVWEASADFITTETADRSSVVAPGLINTKPVSVPRDIGLLFYGSLSPRRLALLEKLENSGLRPSVHFGVFGEARNALIDRAQVVVDIKQNEGDPDDPTRTFFLDSRGACVLSENDKDPKRRLAPWNIVEQCRNLLKNEGKRAEHATSRLAELNQTDTTAAVVQLSKILRGANRIKVVAAE
jgi:hypothetical protein